RCAAAARPTDRRPRAASRVPPRQAANARARPVRPRTRAVPVDEAQSAGHVHSCDGSFATGAIVADDLCRVNELLRRFHKAFALCCAIMKRVNRTPLLSAAAVALLVTAGHARGTQPPGRGGAPAGRPAPPPLMQTPPKPVVANAKPVRLCESLAAVALPNTTIESATVDADNAGVCRVVAITTHPPTNDKVRIWIAIPMANWNGRFLGTGGGGLVGGNPAGVNQ